MNPADIIAVLSLINGAFIEGQKLAVTLNGKELTNDELRALLADVRVRVEINRTN